MNQQSNPDMRKQEREQILDLGSDLTRSGSSNIYTLTIIGQIEGHQVAPENVKTTKYEHILPLLAGIEESDEIEGLLIILNTMGGDVEAGLALAELIASMKKPTVTLVLGGSHSIGVPLAVAGSHSFIVPSATMTIHPVRISGTVIGAPQTYRYFHDMQERILTFVAAHSKADKEVLRSLMMKPDEIANDIGSILDGEEAVRLGLIDEVGGLDAALTSLKNMIQSNRSRK